MPLMGRKTEEERSAKAAQKAADQAQQQRMRRVQEFFRSPAGQARRAYAQGDHVFQYSLDVMSQKAIIVAMVGSSTAKRVTDPTTILNSVCREGWELVNGSFVFVEQGQQSRDKFMSSGQNVAIKGTTVGYYLFKRCEGNKQDLPTPWDIVDVQDTGECPWCDSEIAMNATECPVCGNEVTPAA